MGELEGSGTDLDDSPALAGLRVAPSRRGASAAAERFWLGAAGSKGALGTGRSQSLLWVSRRSGRYSVLCALLVGYLSQSGKVILRL